MNTNKLFSILGLLLASPILSVFVTAEEQVEIMPLAVTEVSVSLLAQEAEDAKAEADYIQVVLESRNKARMKSQAALMVAKSSEEVAYLEAELREIDEAISETMIAAEASSVSAREIMAFESGSREAVLYNGLV